MVEANAAFIEDQWRRLHERMRLTPDAKTLPELLRSWSSPGRYYHKATHLQRGLDALQREGAQVDLVRLAWFFHDAIYVVGRSDNEQVSADWFERYVRDRKLNGDLVRRGVALILFTKDHQGAVTTDPLWPVMNDTDLGIFATPRAVYDRYADDVWKEYSAVYDRQNFVLGRAAFMTAFMARPIFLTPAMRGQEPVARANITAEVDRLQAEAKREGWLGA